MVCSSRGRESHLPPVATNGALTKGRHRLIGGAGLGLTIRDLLLPALSALERIADRLLSHGDLRLLHVLLLELFILCALLVRCQFLICHDHKSQRGNLAQEHASSKLLVVLALQTCEERAQLGAVLRCLALERREAGLLDFDGARKNFLHRLGVLERQPVVEQPNTIVATLAVRAVEVHLVELEVSLLQIPLVWLAKGASGRGGGGDRFRCRGCCGFLLFLCVLGGVDVLLPLLDDLAGDASNVAICVRAQPPYRDACLCRL
ncbi:hypothetical protein QBC34DRAFT_141552 [Podospora aff. communis PSN243]|uniref:Uncharacterized protein n=1 Tax=Podospora aff. communis PSN243 TaxID=3040156 RepID=A0AAV9H4J2_9PEZI|nr:hypothetical protein QBC34DRAFT_141552 [Podospora aff. communis PSN243]